MGRFATGVTVVAAEHHGEIHGMTANAVTSVSIEPLVVLVCVDKRARMTRFIQQAGGFSINMLSEEQEALSQFFAGTWRHAGAPEFRFVPWVGGPRLVGSLAAIGCRVDRFVEAGDHWIVLGDVEGLDEGDPAGRPLIFYGGRYRRLTEAEGPPAPEEWTAAAVRVHYDEWGGSPELPSPEDS
jgi:flavin reductase (DIM6/NTAB) family NADH-FMN oxidoreductase RutF